MDNSNVNIDLIRGHVDTFILRSLMNEDKYGYEILNEIKEKSNGLFSLKQPTLYSCLKRLEKLGNITSYKGGVSNGAQRVYYQLTEAGRQYLLLDQYQWEFSRTIINNLLSDKEFDTEQEKPFDPSSYRPLTRRNVRPYDEVSEENTVARQDNSVDELLEQKFKEEQNINTSFDDKLTQQESQVDNKRVYFPDDIYREKIEKIQLNEESYPSDNINQVETQIFNSKSPETSQNSNDLSDDVSLDGQDDLDYGSLPEDFSYSVYRGKPQNEVSYIDAFDKVLSREMSAEYEVPKQQSVSEAPPQILTMNQLRTEMFTDGYNLKLYQRKNTVDYYCNNYYYSNKINRDTSIIMYLAVIFQILLIHICIPSAVRVSWGACIGAMAGLFAVPLVTLIAYSINPKKRTKANYSLRNALLNSLLVIIQAIFVIVLLGFFVFHANIENANSMINPIIIPLVLLINVPITVAIYSWLYNSKHYHVN